MIKRGTLILYRPCRRDRCPCGSAATYSKCCFLEYGETMTYIAQCSPWPAEDGEVVVKLAGLGTVVSLSRCIEIKGENL